MRQAAPDTTGLTVIHENEWLTVYRVESWYDNLTVHTTLYLAPRDAQGTMLVLDAAEAIGSGRTPLDVRLTVDAMNRSGGDNPVQYRQWAQWRAQGDDIGNAPASCGFLRSIPCSVAHTADGGLLVTASALMADYEPGTVYLCGALTVQEEGGSAGTEAFAMNVRANSGYRHYTMMPIGETTPLEMLDLVVTATDYGCYISSKIRLNDAGEPWKNVSIRPLTYNGVPVTVSDTAVTLSQSSPHYTIWVRLDGEFIMPESMTFEIYNTENGKIYWTLDSVYKQNYMHFRGP